MASGLKETVERDDRLDVKRICIAFQSACRDDCQMDGVLRAGFGKKSLAPSHELGVVFPSVYFRLESPAGASQISPDSPFLLLPDARQQQTTRREKNRAFPSRHRRLKLLDLRK